MRIVGMIKIDNIELDNFNKINVEYELNEKKNLIEIDINGNVVFNYLTNVFFNEIENEIKKDFNSFFKMKYKENDYGLTITIKPFKSCLLNVLHVGEIKMYMVIHNASQITKNDMDELRLNVEWIANNLLQGHIITDKKMIKKV
ncbi:hypothetical protein [Galbibacter pacificus]|uniref:Uncharacterized protein n=1 Tax=Galbibacter pacificus TaxID=2996052 RepID=A0ABT6FR80_9FLAO|nr:hypothetical protein [Galbibacter pacificus]MDG3581780.1 hypothetical protein [Galbibacter pacificus]MDG3585746.1 hypothetical protein [Galbibacter pacificus]